MEQMTKLGAIKKYFGTPERPVELKELKELTQPDREELAQGAARELGVELAPPVR